MECLTDTPIQTAARFCARRFSYAGRQRAWALRAWVTHPYSEEELKQQRWDAYVARVHLHDLTHQGYSNSATFLAALYLDQSTAFRAQLPGMWRKDGTVNADKVRKAFGQLGMTIDPWAYECPVEAPEEFQHYHNPIRAKLNVNWDEVAAEFTQEKMKDSMGFPETRAAA